MTEATFVLFAPKAQLTRLRDGDVEVSSDFTQNRREGQHTCLACEQGEKEHDRWRPEARATGTLESS